MKSPIPALEFRPAILADVPALASLVELSVRGLQGQDYSAAQIESALGSALGVDTQLIHDGTYFIAELETPEDGRLMVGCGGWSRRKTLCGSDHGPERDAGLLDPAHDAAKIRAIFVHPHWARRGIGSRILEFCEDAARAAGFRRLEMGSTLTGVPLYRLKGYVEIGRIEVPLPNGQDLPVVRMAKTLE